MELDQQGDNQRSSTGLAIAASVAAGDANRQRMSQARVPEGNPSDDKERGSQNGNGWPVLADAGDERKQGDTRNAGLRNYAEDGELEERVAGKKNCRSP